MNKEEFIKNFCNNLNKLRTSKNISAYELSLRLGKNKGYVSAVENGKINISLFTIFDICKILDINIKELF